MPGEPFYFGGGGEGVGEAITWGIPHSVSIYIMVISALVAVSLISVVAGRNGVFIYVS